MAFNQIVLDFNSWVLEFRISMTWNAKFQLGLVDSSLNPSRLSSIWLVESWISSQFGLKCQVSTWIGRFVFESFKIVFDLTSRVLNFVSVRLEMSSFISGLSCFHLIWIFFLASTNFRLQNGDFQSQIHLLNLELNIGTWLILKSMGSTVSIGIQLQIPAELQMDGIPCRGLKFTKTGSKSVSWATLHSPVQLEMIHGGA